VNKREIIVCSDTDELGHRAADQFVASAQQAIGARGRFCVALSGGTTPRALYERLAEPAFGSAIAWPRVHLFWGDERCVPPDDPASNYRVARDSLLSKIAIPAGNVHRMSGEKEPRAAAAEYEELLRDFFGLAPGVWPRLDLILLGLGEDGHTASLFPGTPAVNETGRLVVANHVAKLRADRLTLTLPVVNAARYVVFLVAGASKAGAVRQILSGAGSALPAAQVQLADGRLVWLLTRDAAGAPPADSGV
jgi:6-phosphogluconolactonase